MLLTGAGLSLSPGPANLATLGAAQRESGVASAVFNTAERAGVSVGAAALNTIAATSTAAYLAAHLHHREEWLAAVVHDYGGSTLERRWLDQRPARRANQRAARPARGYLGQPAPPPASL